MGGEDINIYIFFGGGLYFLVVVDAVVVVVVAASATLSFSLWRNIAHELRAYMMKMHGMHL